MSQTKLKIVLVFWEGYFLLVTFSWQFCMKVKVFNQLW